MLDYATLTKELYKNRKEGKASVNAKVFLSSVSAAHNLPAIYFCGDPIQYLQVADFMRDEVVFEEQEVPMTALDMLKRSK